MAIEKTSETKAGTLLEKEKTVLGSAFGDSVYTGESERVAVIYDQTVTMDTAKVLDWIPPYRSAMKNDIETFIPNANEDQPKVIYYKVPLAYAKRVLNNLPHKYRLAYPDTLDVKGKKLYAVRPKVDEKGKIVLNEFGKPTFLKKRKNQD